MFYPVFSSERVKTVPVKGRIVKDTTTEYPEGGGRNPSSGGHGIPALTLDKTLVRMHSIIAKTKSINYF